MLSIREATKSFGGITVVDNVSFDVRKGEVHALLGANGAGKSTLINILGGRFADARGRFILNGRTLRLSDPTTAIREGISIVHQEADLVPDLSVAENIFLGQESPSKTSAGTLFRVMRRTEMTGRAAKLLSDYGLDIPADTPVRLLSVAERQLVQIARALSRNAAVVVFDEPTARLGPNERKLLFSIFDRLRADGRMVIFVTHYLDEVMQTANRATVMRDGRRVDTVEVAATSVAGLSQLMVGNDVVPHARRKKAVSDDVAIKLQTGQLPDFTTLSLTVAKGEIVGLLGHPGSGRHEVTRAIVRSLRSGSMGNRIGFLPEDRRSEAIFPFLSVAENIVLASLTDRSLLSRRKHGEEQTIARDVIARFSLKCRGPDQPIGELSGGNQQKAVFGRATVLRPHAYVIECPTVGVDVKAANEIHLLIFDLADGGAGVILATDDLDEALTLCDRILIMFRQEIVAEFPAGAATRQDLIAAMGASRETSDA